MTTARDLTVRLADLLRREHGALAEFLVALADFDRRRLWLELGHASLFYFLHRELGLSKGAAFYRKTAAELVQRFPEIVEPLRDGRLCLSSVVELSKVLTPGNREEVLPKFFQLSKREAQAVSAALLPDEAAPHREVVTAVRAPAVPGPVAEERSIGGPANDVRRSWAEAAHAVHPDEPRRANSGEPVRGAPSSRPRGPHTAAEPLTADLNRLHVTVSRRFLQKLEAARAALSHSRSGASAEEILETGLDLVLERHAKRRGLVERRRREPPPAESDHVPAHVKRAVWERDGGRCQWPLEGGSICGSTHRVELDHIVPQARGGRSTIESMRLLCRVHNDLAARRVYGDTWMDRFTRGPAGPRSGEEVASYLSA